MVLPMRELPHEVRTEDETVHQSAYDVIEQSVIGEGTVSTVVADDKHGGEQRTLYGGDTRTVIRNH